MLLDNMMPHMTGKEAAIKLRALDYRGFIVGVTGNVLDEDLEEFRESGCNEVITKPLDVPELRRTLISLGVPIPRKDTQLRKVPLATKESAPDPSIVESGVE
jgi:CheY-like chemotaxis protein